MKLQLTLLVLPVIIFALSGCSATPITPEGKLVREINKDWANPCTFLGSEETSSYMKVGGRANYLEVRNNIRNITAARGGNAYVINDFSGDGRGHYSAIFEIYKCPPSKKNKR